jgi:hypothetical protein
MQPLASTPVTQAADPIGPVRCWAPAASPISDYFDNREAIEHQPRCGRSTSDTGSVARGRVWKRYSPQAGRSAEHWIHLRTTNPIEKGKLLERPRNITPESSTGPAGTTGTEVEADRQTNNE